MTMANAMPSVTSEWPDWMNPLLVRSLRQSLRSRAFEWILLWLCGSSTLLMVCGSLLPEGQMDEVTVFFWINAAVVLHLLLPGRMMVAVQDDRRPGNFDLIKMTRTDADGLVMQHLKTLMCHAGLVVSILLPYVLLRYYLGGVELVRELVYLGLLYGTTFVLGAVGLWVAAVGTVGKVILGGLLLGAVPVFEVMTVAVAFMPGPFHERVGVLMPWLLGGFIATAIGTSVAGDFLANPMEDD